MTSLKTLVAAAAIALFSGAAMAQTTAPAPTAAPKASTTAPTTAPAAPKKAAKVVKPKLTKEEIAAAKEAKAAKSKACYGQADDQKLKGKPRKAFHKKCMAAA